jgi:hypothetical protein
MGAAIGGLDSYEGLEKWLVDSAHGIDPNRRLLRLPAGVTRSFLNLGGESIVLKRFVFGDRYASVGTEILLQSPLWKVVAVFVALAAVFVAVARFRQTRPALAVLLCGALPVLGFAVFLFETSEPARYQPAYPSLFVAVAAVLLLKEPVRLARCCLVGFAALMALINGTAYGWSLRAKPQVAAERALLVNRHAGGNGVAFIVSFRDPLSTYVQKVPFSPLNRPGALPLFHVIGAGDSTVNGWPRASACRVLEVWEKGGEAWVSDRLAAPRPLPEWNWAENDDPRVKWEDLPAFFGGLARDLHAGGHDGFFRVAVTPENRERLSSQCQSKRGE